MFDYANRTYVEARFELFRDKCSLTDEDITILMGFIVNGYSVKEQSDEEYQAFLKEVKKLNKGMCPAYSAVSRQGKWTGYVASGAVYVPNYHSCVSAQRCSGASANIIWNVLPEHKPGFFRRIFSFFLGLL